MHYSSNAELSLLSIASVLVCRIHRLLKASFAKQESANGHARKWSFDAKARAALLDMSHQDLSDPADKDLAAAVQTAAEQVHRSLLDNINTGAAVEALLELVAVTNKYIKQREEIAANAAGNLETRTDFPCSNWEV